MTAGCTETNDCESADAQRRRSVVEGKHIKDSDMDTSVGQWREQVAKGDTKK